MPFPKRAPRRPKLPPRLTWKVSAQLSVHELESEVQQLTDAGYRILSILPAGEISAGSAHVSHPAVTVVAYRNETRVAAARGTFQQPEQESA